MSVRIGINPLTWTNDDLPSLGANTPLETCLREGKLAGFSGFELGNKFPRTTAELGPILHGHNLRLVSGWYSGQLLRQSVEQEIQAITPHLTLLRDLGATVMVYCEVSHSIHGAQQTPLSLRPTMNNDEWQQFCRRLNELANYCADQGVRIAYHHHMGTVVQSEADIDRLMHHTHDTLGLLLDTGHLTFAGGDPIALQQRYASRINHVHCKDLREAVLHDVLKRNISFLNAVLLGVFTVPGDGFINYPDLFSGLAAADYQGWLVVEAEQDPAIAHPLTYAKLGYQNLKTYCLNAGLQVLD